MNLTVLQSDLNKALSVASRFASAKAQLPVLGNILLKAQKNKLTVAATNLESSISITIGAQVAETGEITAPARIITDIVSHLPKEHIELTLVKEKLSLTTGNSTSHVSGISASDFPEIPNTIGESFLKVPTHELKDAISKVLFATSPDETRPVLTGLLVIIDPSGLTFVATDGSRLSEKRLSGEFSKTESRFVIPKNAVAELVRLLSDESDIDMSFSEKDSQCLFGLTDTVLSSRLIQGEFPNYTKIIPKRHEIALQTDTEEFKRAIRVASVFARDSSNVVRLTLLKNSIKVLAQSDKAGEQISEVDAKVEGNTGKDGITIGFNYKFIEDFLGTVTGESVDMEFTDSDTAGIFRDPKDIHFLHLIMPVKL